MSGGRAGLSCRILVRVNVATWSFDWLRFLNGEMHWISPYKVGLQQPDFFGSYVIWELRCSSDSGHASRPHARSRVSSAGHSARLDRAISCAV